MSDMYYGAAAYGITEMERAVPAVVAEWYRNNLLTCAGCLQPIARGLRHQIRGTWAYHPSCGQRAAAAEAKQVIATDYLPDRVLATITGTGVVFDPAGCTRQVGEGQYERERFASGCFDSSLRSGGQLLLVNHAGPAIHGRFARIAEDGGKLRFRFTLFDAPRERSVLDRIRSGAIRFCSISTGADSQTRSVWSGGPVVEYTRANLVEISLMDGRKPAWFGTSIEIES